MSTYEDFLHGKQHRARDGAVPFAWKASFLFDFQSALVEWALQGRAAIFADCGLGKTPMQLVWAQNVVQHTNRHVLLLTPLAVCGQTLNEARKFGIPCVRSKDGHIPDAPSIVIANYERLHLFDAQHFAGLVCDESSILKHFNGATQKAVTRFALKVPYRLLCTATAAPNDYVELGTSSEVLGELGYSDMLSRFFKQDDQFHRLNQIKNKRGHDLSGQSALLAAGGKYRLKGHAEIPFWRWVASWAKACRKPSDLGFDDGRFALPALVEREHVVVPDTPPDGFLFTIPTRGLEAERAERRRTLDKRCALVADLTAESPSAVVWCHANAEGDRLERLIPGAVQVSGAQSDDEKEDAYARFASGDARVMVTKPKIGAWGLNWQHCAHVVTFASHSYEQYYQSVRRCWRFGQRSPVTVDIVYTEGEQGVRDNMSRKSQAADQMFARLIEHMTAAQGVAAHTHTSQRIEVPAWIRS